MSFAESFANNLIKIDLEHSAFFWAAFYMSIVYDWVGVKKMDLNMSDIDFP